MVRSPNLSCFYPPPPRQLLYLCRQVYKEVMPLLYSQNQFRVSPRRSEISGLHLNVLWTLSSEVWAHIKSLHIGMTEITPSHSALSPDHPSNEEIYFKTVEGSRLPIEWSAFVGHLSRKSLSPSMKMGFNCMVKDVNSGLQINESLEKLPRINSIAVSLSPDSNNRVLESLARKEVFKLTHRRERYLKSHQQRISWSRLPKEIRLQILESTDLLSRVQSTRSHLQYRDGFNVEDGVLVPRAVSCCLVCTPSLSACYCPSKGASMSDTCICPAVPISLFSISIGMSIEAALIFNSKNRSILSDDFSATRRWLFNLSPTHLQQLRTVEVEVSIDQIFRGLQDPKSQVTHDWEALNTSIGTLLRLPRLWLTISMTQIRQEMEKLNLQNDHDYQWIHKSYAQLYNPVYQHLKGRRLRRLHVLLSWQFDYEMAAEKEEMGSGYDSKLEGKLDPPDRDYLRFWLRRERR